MEYNSALKRKWLSLKESTCNVGDLGLISELGRSLEKGKVNHSSILAWKIPWMEEFGGLQFMGRKKLDTTEWLTKQTNKQTKKKNQKKMTKDVESSDRQMKYKVSFKRLSTIFPKIIEKSVRWHFQILERKRMSIKNSMTRKKAQKLQEIQS